MISVCTRTLGRKGHWIFSLSQVIHREKQIISHTALRERHMDFLHCLRKTQYCPFVMISRDKCAWLADGKSHLWGYENIDFLEQMFIDCIKKGKLTTIELENVILICEYQRWVCKMQIKAYDIRILTKSVSITWVWTNELYVSYNCLFLIYNYT